MRATAMMVGLMAATAAGADWPQFRGLNRDGTTPEKGLVRAWPAGGPKVLWTVKLAAGYGGPAVRDGKVYLLDRDAGGGKEGDVLRCFELATGKEEWSFAYPAPGKLSHHGSRSTPTVEEKLIFTVGPFGDMHCIDRATHKPVWTKHVLKDFEGRAPQWGIAQSPLLYKDSVIVAPQSRSAGLAALDKATGKELWRSGPVGEIRYASPVLATIGGVVHAVMITRDVVSGVDAQTGKVLWRFTDWNCQHHVPDVLPVGEGRIFVSGGYDAGSVMLEVTGSGEAFAVKEIARHKTVGAHTQTPLLYNGSIYALCNTNSKADGLVCFGPDLAIRWQTNRSPYLCKGGMVLTGDGILYSMDGQSGVLRIIQPSPEGYKELAQAPLLGGREIWAPVALADGKLLVRDQSQMKCVDVSGRQ